MGRVANDIRGTAATAITRINNIISRVYCTFIVLLTATNIHTEESTLTCSEAWQKTLPWSLRFGYTHYRNAKVRRLDVHLRRPLVAAATFGSQLARAPRKIRSGVPLQVGFSIQG